jgi:hypothetical protein
MICCKFEQGHEDFIFLKRFYLVVILAVQLSYSVNLVQEEALVDLLWLFHEALA